MIQRMFDLLQTVMTSDRMNVNECFVTLKDHKPNFADKLPILIEKLDESASPLSNHYKLKHQEHSQLTAMTLPMF